MAKTTLIGTPQPPNLGDAIPVLRQWLRQHLSRGLHCPVCDQWAKVYKRQINSGMAHSMIRMYRMVGQDWIHVSLIGAKSREEGKLVYWGLVEEQTGQGPHGGRAGYWRLTSEGVQFVRGWRAVAKYALVYNGNFLGFEGPPVTIHDALGTDFDYQSLMNA